MRAVLLISAWHDSKQEQCCRRRGRRRGRGGVVLVVITRKSSSGAFGLDATQDTLASSSGGLEVATSQFFQGIQTASTLRAASGGRV